MTAALPVTCPRWCCSHDVVAEPDGSTFVVHRGPWFDRSARVQARQGVHVEPDGSVDRRPAELVIDGEAHDLEETRELLAALALAARTVELT